MRSFKFIVVVLVLGLLGPGLPSMWGSLFGLFPDFWGDVIVNTDTTAEGRKLTPPTTGKPVYYLGRSLERAAHWSHARPIDPPGSHPGSQRPQLPTPGRQGPAQTPVERIQKTSPARRRELWLQQPAAVLLYLPRLGSCPFQDLTNTTLPSLHPTHGCRTFRPPPAALLDRPSQHKDDGLVR